ncbi:PHD-finger [Dirofilaria immitis]|nr:PHD-finger [Dirofilaria immitis]
MSITDAVGTDGHVGEIVPSAEDSNAKVAEDQPQEEGPDEKQQNQSWITPNKSTLLSQGLLSCLHCGEAVRSFEASEDYALHYLTRSVVKMMDNIGFSTCHESVVNILTDLCRRYLQKLWVDSKVFAEHAGRRYPIFEDANMVFGKLMFSAAELHAFMKQVEHDPFENDVPLFPVRKPSPSLLSIYGPVSDKELATRPEHIPRYFPAVHPEWCSDQIGVRTVEVSAVKSAIQGPAKNSKCIPRGRVSKSKISFPDFCGSTAKELGFVRPQKLPPKSSANIAALQIMGTATSSASKTKFRKCSMNESASSSKSVDEHVKAESPKDKDSPDKLFTQRSIGMFGMPPSALVHTESVMSEKMKKKRKKDRDRDKDRTKEKKIKHREKFTDENEENPSTSSLISLSTESLTYGKSSTSSSCSTIAKTDDQGIKKLANQQQDVLPVLQKLPSSSEHDQIKRKVVDLKSITNEEPLTDVYFSHSLSGSGGKDVVVCGKEEDANKFKNNQPVDLRINDDHNGSGVGSQMAEILIPQQSSNSLISENLHILASIVRLHFASVALLLQVLSGCSIFLKGFNGSLCKSFNSEEGVKDETQKNGEKDTSKSTLVENVRGKLEKRKFGEKSNEWRKGPKKSTADSSLSVVVDNIIKSSATDDNPISQDLKALKVVLSRSTGQKVFTALSPSSDIERVVKDVEQKYDAGNMQRSASIAVDESQGAGDICEKKKSIGRHHNKEHKRKDKRKYKEHKKSKTKDKERKYIKLRPEKLCLKRSGEHILSDEISAPKIPKLKIRFGSNSSGVSASSSGIISATSPTILTSTLSSLKSSEKDLPSLIDQNIQVTQPTVKVEDLATPYASLKSDGNIRPRKRQPVTKAELKALPKLPLKAKTCGTKELFLFCCNQFCVSFATASTSTTSILPVFISLARCLEMKRGKWGTRMALPTGRSLISVVLLLLLRVCSNCVLLTDEKPDARCPARQEDFKITHRCFVSCYNFALNLPALPEQSRTRTTFCGFGIDCCNLVCLGSGFTGGQGSAEVAVSPAISRADAGLEQRSYIQQLAGKHLRMDNRKKDVYSAAAFSSSEKMPKVTGKERSSESGIQGMTAKCDLKSTGQLASANAFSTFLTDERRQEKECSKRDLEILKKKPDQVYAEADELDLVKAKLGKEKDPFKRVCDSNLVFNDRFSGKLKSKEPEKEKKKERQHYSLEKMKKNGRERETHHAQNAHDKERDQTKRDEKGLGMADEKKEAVQDRQKERGSDESDKHRERLGKVTGFGERRKRKGTGKDEEFGKDVEKDAKGYAKEKGCSSETKDRGKYQTKKIDLEEKVRSHDKELKDKEKRTKHSGGRGKEHSTGKSSKEFEKIHSGEEEEFVGLSHAKTKNSGKDGSIGDPNNSHLPYNPLLKTEQALERIQNWSLLDVQDRGRHEMIFVVFLVIFAKEQLSKRCSADTDVFENKSPTAGSLTKSSDKKSATLDSDDSLDNMWICPECSVAYVEGATDMVGCDACDNWFHWSCVGLLVAPPDDAPWYCQNCAKKT